MGCDIFSWVEIYDPQTNKWRAVRDAFPADDWEKGHYGKAFVSAPFRSRDYGLFGFLAGVRNYANCEPLDLPRGLPVGCDLTGGCSVIDELEVVADLHIQNTETLIHHFHSYSWFLLSELLSFDYEKVFWNRRIQRGKDGAALAQEGEGVHQSYPEFLGRDYFGALATMKTLGEPNHIRVVFCFGD